MRQEQQRDVRRFQEQLGLTRENRRSLRAISSRRSLSLSLFLFASLWRFRVDEGTKFLLSRSPFSIDRRHPFFQHHVFILIFHYTTIISILEMGSNGRLVMRHNLRVEIDRERKKERKKGDREAKGKRKGKLLF